jgi:hypothetical protein
LWRCARARPFRILDEHETMLCVVPRTTTEEVTRFKAYGHRAAQV